MANKRVQHCSDCQHLYLMGETKNKYRFCGHEEALTEGEIMGLHVNGKETAHRRIYAPALPSPKWCPLRRRSVYMKKWQCNGCGKEIEVEESYEPEMCCRGLRDGCGCMGLPTNPVFCDECEIKYFGEIPQVEGRE